MANVIEILINAKNNASAEFEKATGSLAQFTTAAGLAGAAGALAGQAIVTAMQGAQQAIIGNATAHADLIEQLDRLSHNTGLSVEQLQVFERQIVRDGLSADQLTIALRYFQNQLDSGDKALADYGITSRDTFTALQQLAVAQSRVTDATQRAGLAAHTLGVRNSEIFDSVVQVAGAYDSRLAEAMRNNAVLSDTQIQKFRDLDSALDDFKDTATAFKAATAEFFAPMIQSSVEMISALTRVSGELSEIERKDAAVRRARGERLAPALLPAVSAHATDQQSTFEQWQAYFRKQASGGGNSGGDQGGPLGKATTWARPWDPNAGGLGVMARLPEAIFTLADSIKLTLGGPGGAGDASGKSTEAINKPLDAIHSAAMRLGQNLEGTFRSAFSSILAITSSSTNIVVQLFTALANGILQTISDMLAEAAARGLVDFALSFVSGGTSAAAKVGSVFKSQPLSAGRSTGNTFVIQAIDARSAMDDILNPTGSLRRANDRVRDIAIAQAG